MKVIKKKKIEYELVSLADEEKADCERIIKEVKEEEQKPFDPESLKKLKKMRKGKSVEGQET